MARSDLLIRLIQAGKKGDKELLSKTVDALIAEEQNKKHFVLADQLRELQKDPFNGNGNFTKYNYDKIENLVYEKSPTKTLENLILNEDTHKLCLELVEEHRRVDLLRSYNLEPRHRIIFTGPPGNGKTSLAEAFAEKLMIPFILVKYEGIITSFLGETATRLKYLFDYIRTQKCVIFFDEFDTIGKERGDIHETGEIKRVVSSLLMQIDKVPSYTIIIVATNHPELLDRAVWRRFQLKINLPKPETNDIERYLKYFRQNVSDSFNVSYKELAAKLLGLSYSEIEEFCLNVLRAHVLSSFQENIKDILKRNLKYIESYKN